MNVSVPCPMLFYGGLVFCFLRRLVIYFCRAFVMFYNNDHLFISFKEAHKYFGGLGDVVINIYLPRFNS